MIYDRQKIARALARTGYPKQAVEIQESLATAGALLNIWGMRIAVDRKGRPVLWIKEGRRYRRAVLR